jgi:hypothetical protein
MKSEACGYTGTFQAIRNTPAGMNLAAVRRLLEAKRCTV